MISGTMQVARSQYKLQQCQTSNHPTKKCGLPDDCNISWDVTSKDSYIANERGES